MHCCSPAMVILDCRSLLKRNNCLFDLNWLKFHRSFSDTQALSIAIHFHQVLSSQDTIFFKRKQQSKTPKASEQ